MNRKILVWIIAPIILVMIALVGPSPQSPEYDTKFPTVNNSLRILGDSIDTVEKLNPAVKINNEARIIWADSVGIKTEWAIVYLHGFSASHMEGNPVHINTASTFGMNLYLARLSDHGVLSDSALLHFTPDRLWESAKLALAIGNKIGTKVVLMSTSTGGTLALKLAEIYPDKIDALINYSPNIRINNPLAWFLNNPWGGQVLSAIADNGYINTVGQEDTVISQYWDTHYRMESLPQLEELVETTMQTEVFEKVTCPVLTIAYYKDEDNQDPTVKVSAMRWMHKHLGVDNTFKKFVVLPDVEVHPLASGLRSKDIEGVERETNAFIMDVLGVQQVKPN